MLTYYLRFESKTQKIIQLNDLKWTQLNKPTISLKFFTI